MVSSESPLQKAGLRNLNETAAQSHKARDAVGIILFPNGTIMRLTRYTNNNIAAQSVPGNQTLAVNLMARAWNAANDLQTAATLEVAESVARIWACTSLIHDVA